MDDISVHVAQRSTVYIGTIHDKEPTNKFYISLISLVYQPDQESSFEVIYYFFLQLDVTGPF